VDWDEIVTGQADQAAEALVETILQAAWKHIPRKEIKQRKCSHPWVNSRVLELVKQKHLAAGTPEARTAGEVCSAGVAEEFAKYVEKEKARLKEQPRASKGWWSMTRRLLSQKGRTCSIPALRKGDGEWCMGAEEKANHIADVFKNKYKMADAEVNDYSRIDVPHYREQKYLKEITEELAEKVLSDLRSDSATGPDELPSRILKECAKALARPLCMLARIIISQGRWPEAWTLHWIVPLYKKKQVFLAQNYRGVHLTAQISKAMERLFRTLFMPFLLQCNVFGPNQFAYVPERGARDALALMLLVWITALAKKRNICIYCSDVAGAFDRVPKGRLIAKLKAKKLHASLVNVLASWLRDRKAKVIVGGKSSKMFELANMVFQGTVLGPPLWNTFYEDARQAVQDANFQEVVYADDLNAYRLFSCSTSNTSILESAKMCQAELHQWGAANQVQFDPAKESFHVLAKSDALGDDFKLLGIVFDVHLNMTAAVGEVVQQAGWKLRMLMRTRRYYTDAELVILYKAHLLSYLEYRTPAVYHATRDILARLDRVQTRFLKNAGLDEKDALMYFNLAPLAARRDIAMMGLIHRTVSKKGPMHFREYFRKLPSGKLMDPRETGGCELVKRSALGLCAIYNMLPESCTREKTVKGFQRSLQEIIKRRLADNCNDWVNTFSPRVPLWKHPLKVCV
jgi:hypothetical protein